MLLRELFEADDFGQDPNPPPELQQQSNAGHEGEMTEKMRQAALDFLTPFMGQNLPFVTVNQVIDALRHNNFGLVINRAVVMQLLDPTKVPSIAKIEGDRIYLKDPDAESPENENDAEEEDKQKEQVNQMAQQQAQNSVKQQAQIPALGKLNNA